MDTNTTNGALYTPDNKTQLIVIKENQQTENLIQLLKKLKLLK